MKFEKILRPIKAGKFIIFFILLLLFDIAFWFFPFKLDMTSKQSYTLSASTKKIVTDLDEVVNIKVFVSKELPSRFLLIRQSLKDVLMDYRSISRGKVRVEWIDVEKDDELKKEAQRLGVPPLQFSDLEKDKFQVTQGFFGLAFLLGDKVETIPLVDKTSDLEYQLTSKIYKITQTKQPKVGFVTGHGEQLSSVTYTYQEPLLQAVLADQFLTEAINLDQEEPELIPDNFDMLVIVGPDKEFTIKEKYLLDQFLMKEKPIIFLLETERVSENLQLVKTDHKLEDLLSTYGVNLKNGFVLDMSNEQANFSSGTTIFFTPYPFWVKIKPAGFNNSSVVTADLQTLAFPWVSWLEYEQDDLRITPLVFSSDKSWTQTEDINLDPTQKFNAREGGRKTLAILFNGKLESFFTNKDNPPGFEKENFIDKTQNARFALIADADFINEGMVSRVPQNLYFFANLVEYLANGTELSSIRTKTEDIRPLKELTDKQREFYKYLNVLGTPVLIGFLGFAFLYWRNQKEYKT